MNNAEQVAYWNGPAGERWSREQAVLDRAFEALSRRLLGRAALRPGERVLDVGCGCGTSTLAAADAVGPTGAVLGIDVSAPMLARARERSSARPRVAYRECDASTEALEPTFDVVLSRFGVMFFRDPVAAFTNLRGALRPGGRLAFICWRPVAENEWARVPREAALQHVTPEPPQGPEEPGPFSFGDRARVERILTGAGFTSVECVPVDEKVLVSDEGLDGAVEFAISAGPTARLLREVSDDVKNRVRAALATALRPYLAGNRMTLGGATWLVHARRE
jgi:SAM-dependent methyltransferase